MRALILSDIHANMQALAAVLAAAPEHDIVWNLGDVVGYGASPNETIVCLKELNSIYVRGNHDRACCGLASLDDFNPVARQAAEWTQAQLSRTRRKWLCELPQGPVTVGDGLVCVHGSAADEDIYVQSLGEAIDALQAVPGAWVEFYGHTHVQGGFVRSDDGWYVFKPEYTSKHNEEYFDLPMRRGVRYLLNPGSVGQPRDGDWRAGFALYDDAASVVRFYRVPYDLDRAQKKILAAGLPERLATRLAEGL
jgi:diadenosine tetraphosphatase ApaH/serine/threonine PP2A family protein phosphatase